MVRRMPGMSETISRSDFEDALRRALSNLYDPAVLQDSALVSALGLDARADAIVALRSILLAAIESLRPGEDVPTQSKAWRYFHILYGRFTEQLTQFEISNDLGLSVRQMRRHEKRAFQVLADSLWARYKLESGGDDNAIMTPQALGRAEELAWSGKAFPSESVEVEALVQSALATAESMFRASKLQVAHDVSEGLPRLAVQLVPMRQALLNVLTTALDWMPEGQLTIRAIGQPEEGQIQLSIAGYGTLSARAAEMGAERLRVAHELVEFSGGALEVDTERDADQAFRFHLELPVDVQITVLAIDDNPDTLQLLQRYTVDTRYRLLGESDPERSLAVAEESLPDIILLDVLLQDLDGWELLGRFRAHPQLGDRPVIVCTILPQRDLALSLGAAGFLSKPLSQRQLLSALDAQADRLHG